MKSELAPIAKTMSLETAVVDGRTMKVGRVGDVEVVATLTGMGMGSARRATEQLLDATAVDHVMVVGIAGGVHPEIAVGDLVFPDVVVDGSTETEYRPVHLGSPTARGTIVSSDDFTIEPVAVQRLVDRGVVAVDMETGAVAAVCTERGCAWSVIRSISDMATDHPDDAVLGLAKPDGSPDARAAAKFLLTHPGRIPKLVKLAQGARLAATNAARAARQACASAR
jgi:adenosylhomocysteine nucleosidase